MSDETYNGWANRETWAFNLHWQNDQGIYNYVLETASEVADEPDHVIGETVVQLVKDMIEDESITPEWGNVMRDEIGSWWRINVDETGRAVRESLEAEDGDA